MILNPCDECRYFNFDKGVWETYPHHWVHQDSAMWVGIGFVDAPAVNRGVQRYPWLLRAVVIRP